MTHTTRHITGGAIIIAALIVGVFIEFLVARTYLVPETSTSMDDTLDEYVCASWPDCPALDQSEEVPASTFINTTSSNSGQALVPILMYHHVRAMQAFFNYKERLYSVTPDRLEVQLGSMLEAGYHPITPDDLLYALTTSTSKLPSKPVLITFDDGYKEDYTFVYPILQKLHIPATYFIVSGYGSLGGYMKNDQVKEVSDSGLVTIGSHTQTHAALTHYGDGRRKAEIVGSKQDLEALLGKPVNIIAYPYGFTSRDVEQEVAKDGYDLGFAIGPGALHTSSTRYHLHRIQINQDTNVVNTLDNYVKRGK